MKQPELDAEPLFAEAAALLDCRVKSGIDEMRVE